MRIAVVQTTPGPPEPAHNLRRLAGHLRDAAAAGADVLVTPEMFLTGYAVGRDTVRALAEPADGPSGAAVAALAREHGVAVVWGHPEADGDRVFNAATLVDTDGVVRARYRKTHLFGALDADQFDASDEPPTVVEVAGRRVALMICYDVEFPEYVRRVALEGADVVLVPTANMAPYDVVNTTLVPARAVENQLHVAYANYVGTEADLRYCGLSCVVGPDGTDLARAGSEAEELLLADLDASRLDASRAANTYLTDRRPALYHP